jgi:hypothetical protein
VTDRDSLHSLLDYECLLFLLWLTWFWFTNRSLLQLRCPLVNTTHLNTQLSYECRMIELSVKWSEVKWSEVKWSEVKWNELSFCNFEANRIETTISNSSSVTASIRCSGNILTELLSSNWLLWLSGTMPHSTRIRVLTNCCLAMDYYGFQASCHSMKQTPIIISVSNILHQQWYQWRIENREGRVGKMCCRN